MTTDNGSRTATDAAFLELTKGDSNGSMRVPAEQKKPGEHAEQLALLTGP